MTTNTQAEVDNDALALAVIEHLGPSALAGDKMSVLQAFELGYKAALQKPAERVTVPEGWKLVPTEPTIDIPYYEFSSEELLSFARALLSSEQEIPLNIETWAERCEDHPEHDGIVTNQMIMDRMQEEIDDLRTALLSSERDAQYLSPDDMAALIRFVEICEDSDADGHDVPKEAMKILCELGALRSLGFGRHTTTAFGDYVIEQHFEQSSAKLPLKSIAEHNAMSAAIAQGYIA